MLVRLIRKELLHYAMDARFLIVSLICLLLGVLSIYTGTRNYQIAVRNGAAVTQSMDETLGDWLQRNSNELAWHGYRWYRPPAVLSPLVYGLSGSLGREANIQHERLPEFEASLFETDPIHCLFGVMDFAFLVKFILSIAVLLFTYDAVCGEKEEGTLRLYCSYSVSRATLGLSKLLGATLAVLIPFGIVFLLVCTVLELSSGSTVSGDDWLRIALIFLAFSLYLTVFAAFGLFVSSATHRRLTAFLLLMGLWAIWLFVLPNAAVRLARTVVQSESLYRLVSDETDLRWEIVKQRREEVDAYWDQFQNVNWDSLSEDTRNQMIAGSHQIDTKWDEQLVSRLLSRDRARLNRQAGQTRLAKALGTLSPLSAVTFAATDLAGTGPAQQERLQTELDSYLARYAYWQRTSQYGDDTDVSDSFERFAPQQIETWADVLNRSLPQFLNLVLLALAGYAAAFVTILRYDVR